MTLKSCLASLPVLLALAAASQASGLVIGVVAPSSGPYAILGKQVLDGAKAQAEAAGNSILPIPENCDDASGEDAAKQLISAGATAAIGFLCSNTLQSAMPALASVGIPAITLSARSHILFEDAVKKKWPLYSLAPAPGEEAQATATMIARAWANAPFAIIDDGTINAHELAANIRLELEGKGITPIMTDTYRPGLENQRLLVKQLGKSGASAVYIAGARSDVAVIARDLAEAASGITVMGGESLLAADEGAPLPSGVLAAMPELWHNQPEASAVVQALAEKGVIAEGYVLPAHAAAFIAGKADETKKADEPLGQAIQTGNFPTVLGNVAFGPDHLRKEGAYRLMEWRDGAFEPVINGDQTN